MTQRKPDPSDSAAQEILSYSFLRVFANDGVIDAAELAMIERLALRDGVIDRKERAVLGRIFDRVDTDKLEPEVLRDIEAFREEYDIP